MNTTEAAAELTAVKKELRREMEMRARVYPRWIADPKNRMTQEEADRRSRLMQRALDLIDTMETNGRVVTARFPPGAEHPDAVKVRFPNGKEYDFQRMPEGEQI